MGATDSIKLTERVPGFVRLDEFVSFYEPSGHTWRRQPTLEQPQTEPDLIVFCSWMSANPKHIAKYTAGYQRLFPRTAILLVEASLGDMFWGSTLGSARNIIKRYIPLKAPLTHRQCPSILVHASSNGGANNASWLALNLKNEGYAAPFDSAVFDCTPGKPNLHVVERGIRHSLPNIAWLRALSSVFIFIFLCCYGLWVPLCQLFGFENENILHRVRRVINDRALFGVDVPRLYLYSLTDLLVPHNHVHQHAEEARMKGCAEADQVREVVFQKAGHCNLVAEDAGKYWDAVQAHLGTSNKTFQQWSWPTPIKGL